MSLRFYCLHHFCHGNHHPFNNQHARISNHLSFSRSAYCKENLKKKRKKDSSPKNVSSEQPFLKCSQVMSKRCDPGTDFKLRCARVRFVKVALGKNRRRAGSSGNKTLS